MTTIELTKDNLGEVIDNNDTVIVDFWASWCGPCQAFKPIFEAAADKHPDVVFAKCNTEDQQELAAAFQVRSIPTVMAFRKQRLVFSQPGMLPADAFDTLVNKVRDFDPAAAEQEQQAAAAG